ncbi:MAG: hypothetical protein ACJ78Q_21010 [Chloroflexia bacterium]
MTLRSKYMDPFLPHDVMEGMASKPLRTRRPDPGIDRDDEFHVLLKHAMAAAPERQDGGKLWQQLARKVRGPFGAPALEGPGCTTLEQVLMSSGGRVQLAPFVLSSLTGCPNPSGAKGPETLWEMLRCVPAATAPKSYTWMFS